MPDSPVPPDAPAIPHRNGAFPTTRASAIRGAQSADAAERLRAGHAIARAYWKPAYKHLRIRWRASREDAEDSLQSFFAKVAEKNVFASFDARKGRFRTFFRTCLDRHVQNERKAAAREKRGGGQSLVSLDVEGAEAEIERAGRSAWESPEDCFDREWRRSVLTLAVDALREELTAQGKSVHFASFARYDLCEEAERPTYDTLAREMGLAVTTVTNHLAFCRRELRSKVVAMLREITADEAELLAETRTVFEGR